MPDIVMTVIGKVKWCTNCGALKISEAEWQNSNAYDATGLECNEHGLSSGETKPKSKRDNTTPSNVSNTSSKKQ